MAAEGLRALTSALLQRYQWARQAGITFGGKRDLYEALGYSRTLTLADYRDRYARGGIAGRVVDALPKAVWRGDGELIEDDDPQTRTPFEKDWWTLNDRLRVWTTFRRAHIQASIGSFSILLLGAEGDLNTELPRGKPGGLLYLSPFGGGVVDTTAQRGIGTSQSGADVTVSAWDEDIHSPRFGQPTRYKLARVNIASPQLQREVHFTRVIHIPAPGFLDDAVFGPPALEAPWNYFDDLEKVAGGGAEAFWLRANAGIQFDIDKKMSLNPDPAQAQQELDSLKEQSENYAHQLTRMIRTRGVNVQQLGSDVADFSNPVDALVTLIAGTVGIPKRILTGSEMGQLASTQDRDNFADTITDARTGYAYPVIVRPAIERLITYGYLTEPEQWSVRWPSIAEQTETDKLGIATKMIALNDHGETVVTAEEVREVLGREPLDEDELDDDEEQVAQLEAALRKGGSLSLVVKP